MDKIKLNFTRNSADAIIANVFTNEVEIFATSSPYQLACALDALGQKDMVDIDENGKVSLLGDLDGTFMGTKIGGSIKELVFWSTFCCSAGVLKAHPETPTLDPEYQTVFGYLPPHVTAHVKISRLKCTKKDQRAFNKFIYFPDV